MIIYCDESGTFVPTPNKSSISLVGALIIPEGTLERIEKKYRALRATLCKDGVEVKGRLLSEDQIAKVVEILLKNEALFEVVGIDMGAHSSDSIEMHKNAQAEAITNNLTDQFHENLQKAIWQLRRRLEQLPNQLYVQSVATFELIATVIEHGSIYFSQRRPEALGRFEWVIDAKDRGRITEGEDWWSKTVMPSVQSKSFRKPFGQFTEGDYSHFQRFDRDVPDYLREHMKDPSAETGLDANKIMTENFRFSADPEVGLELADILTNATRRALMNNLKTKGWQDIPRLMIHRGQHYIHLIRLAEPPDDYHYPYMDVLLAFSQGGKNILAPRFRNRD
jgi:hypothetical protein